jgi:hypothetical protein
MSSLPPVARACVCVERGENFKVQLREDYPGIALLPSNNDFWPEPCYAVPEPHSDELLICLDYTGL